MIQVQVLTLELIISLPHLTARRDAGTIGGSLLAATFSHETSTSRPKRQASLGVFFIKGLRWNNEAFKQGLG